MSDTYSYQLLLLSDTLPASGNSSQQIIDTDVITDQYGVPLIPAKRIKGVLREAALEVLEAFQFDYRLENLFLEIFGETGKTANSGYHFSDLTLTESENLTQWLKYLQSPMIKDESETDKKKVKPNPVQGFFTPEIITDQFTQVRRSTRLENGLAAEHSLRTIRVLDKGLSFKGSISPSDGELDEERIQFLNLVMNNLRYLGSNRNRGLGLVKVQDINQEKLRQFIKKFDGGTAR
jgi:CRISPR/Cas system CSM-associated protein Csm3 (group 7 of RAMP superfamily)